MLKTYFIPYRNCKPVNLLQIRHFKLKISFPGVMLYFIPNSSFLLLLRVIAIF